MESLPTTDTTVAAPRLIVFVKAARPGTVKTRLAETLGMEAACAAYRRLVEVLMGTLWGLPAVELRYAPDDARAGIAAWLGNGWVARPQGPGDLGQRLTAAFSHAFADGAPMVMAIGSDCPWITIEDIHTAAASLQTHDVALGPASDGGYWLIGLRERHVELFTGIPWSTSEVFSKTLERARQRHLRVRILRQLDDVDTEADWRRFLADQISDESDAVRTYPSTCR